MKIIRNKVFETNSSSEHTFALEHPSEDPYDYIKDYDYDEEGDDIKEIEDILNNRIKESYYSEQMGLYKIYNYLLKNHLPLLKKFTGTQRIMKVSALKSIIIELDTLSKNI